MVSRLALRTLPRQKPSISFGYASGLAVGLLVQSDGRRPYPGADPKTETQPTAGRSPHLTSGGKAEAAHNDLYGRA